jgi:hypothetical protein
MDGKFLEDSAADIRGKLTVQNGVNIKGTHLTIGKDGVLVVENGDLNVPDGPIVGSIDSDCNATVNVQNGNLISGTNGYDGLQIKNLTVNGNVTTPSLRVDPGYSMRVSGSVNSPGYIMGNLTVCKGITAEWDYDYRGALHVGPSGSLSSGGTVSAIATGENANVETGLYIDGGILNARYARYFTSYSYSSTGHTYGPTQTMSMPNYCPSWCTTNGYSCGN